MNNARKFAFIGNSHIAFWPLEIYFPKWECFNYGLPGEGLNYIESFQRDVSDCKAVIQFGTNDIYRLNDENMDAYVERYVQAVRAIPTLQTYLFSLFPRNDYADSVAVNKFIFRLNQKIREKVKDTGIVYMDVFEYFLDNGRLNDALTIDDLHLNSAGYRILTNCLISKIEEE